MRNSCLLLTVILGIFIPVLLNAQDANNAAAIALNARAIFDSPSSPAFGNPSANVTIVEFYDYQCSYCKASEEGLERILQEDGNIKIVYKDFPKLGALSVTAAIATLASARQDPNKYLQLHDILMSKDVRLTGEEMIYQAAASVGLDVGRLKQDMGDPAIAQQIQDNITLGRSIGVSVTPSFVVGRHLYPGYATYDKLKQFVDYERSTAHAR